MNEKGKQKVKTLPHKLGFDSCLWPEHFFFVVSSLPDLILATASCFFVSVRHVHCAFPSLSAVYTK